MRRLVPAIPVFLLVFSHVLAPALPAQESPSPEPAADEVFFDTVDVNVVNVEVFVTDKGGKPVRDLSKSDFQLFQDGDPVEISNFLAVDESRASREARGETLMSRPAVPRDQRLHVVAFVDNLNIQPKNRNQVVQHMRRFLRESLDNQDRVMLVSFDGRLHILQEFTSVPELVQPVLEDLRRQTTRGHELLTEKRLLLRNIEDVTIDINAFTQGLAQVEAQQTLAGIFNYAEAVNNRTRYTLDAMRQLVDSLSGLPGRKALLYMSGGLPMRPADALLEAWRNKFGQFALQLNTGDASAEGQSYDATTEFQKLVAHANANRVILYTIDAGGSKNFGTVSAEIGGFDINGLSTAGSGRAWSADLESREASSFRSSFQYMAESTGGLAFINTRGLGKTLGKLATDFDTYYSLGYRPDKDADGKYHRLSVRVPGHKVNIRHRAGFQDKTSEERMSDRTLSALLLNVSDNPLQVALERGKSEPEDESKWRGKKKIYQVPLLVKVPLGNIALLPNQAAHQGRISVYVAVRDDQGRTSSVQRVPLPIQIPNEKMQDVRDQFAGYVFSLRMKEGFQRVAVGVRDEIAAVDSTIRLNFRVGEGIESIRPRTSGGPTDVSALPADGDR